MRSLAITASGYAGAYTLIGTAYADHRPWSGDAGLLLLAKVHVGALGAMRDFKRYCKDTLFVSGHVKRAYTEYSCALRKFLDDLEAKL